jgi:hypothetical protein
MTGQRQRPWVVWPVGGGGGAVTTSNGGLVPAVAVVS